LTEREGSRARHRNHRRYTKKKQHNRNVFGVKRKQDATTAKETTAKKKEFVLKR
jgi:hypothetical protein